MKLLKKDIKDLATVSNYSANRFAADFGRDNNTNFKYDYDNEGKALAEHSAIDAKIELSNIGMKWELYFLDRLQFLVLIDGSFPSLN